MPNIDCVHGSDLGIYSHIPPIPPVIPPPPPPPLPHCGEYPMPFPYGYPYVFPCPENTWVTPEEVAKVKDNSTESKICKLSKKSATITKMISALEDKNKDIILRVGDSTYNFGAYKQESNGNLEITETGESIMAILRKELTSIKEEISDLAAQLGD